MNIHPNTCRSRRATNGSGFAFDERCAERRRPRQVGSVWETRYRRYALAMIEDVEMRQAEAEPDKRSPRAKARYARVERSNAV